MKYLVTFQDAIGEYRNTGTTTRAVVELQTLKGVINRARRMVNYRADKPFRVSYLSCVTGSERNLYEGV